MIWRATFKKLQYLTLLTGFIVVISSPAHANDDVFCRADTRPPSEVFSRGITSWGNDQSLLRHVSGVSSYSGRGSAYISTSHTFNVCVMFLYMLKKPTAYVYRIRPDQNFYSVGRSLTYLLNQSYISQVTKMTIRDLLEEYGDEDEYVSEFSIDASQIQSVTEYSIRNARPVEVRTLVNDNFRPTDSTFNPMPLQRIDTYNMLYFFVGPEKQALFFDACPVQDGARAPEGNGYGCGSFAKKYNRTIVKTVLDLLD